MRIAVVILTVFLFCSFTRGQDIVGGAKAARSMADLRKGVVEKRVVLVRKNLPTARQATEVNALLAEGSVHLSFLRELSETRTVPKEYEQSMLENFAILQSIKKLGRIGQPQWEQLQALNADLRVKSNHAALGGESGFQSIEVIVRTKKNGQELSNCEVWFVKEAYKNNVAKYDTFHGFSPAVRKIPPGRYIMWTKATDTSKAEGQKTPKEFGDGLGRVEIDLTAP